MDKFYPPYFPCYIPLPNGKPAAGGKLYAYYTGTDNLAPLYAEDGTILVGSVADIDSSGQAHFLLDPAITYRLKVVPPVGSQMPDQIYDNVRVANGGGGGGMENPMTEQGDMIVGGTAGIPVRLAHPNGIGFLRAAISFGMKVLQWVGLFPGTGIKIENDGAGATISVDESVVMTNPMTAKGDLIVGSTDGEPSRLGVGTDGDILATALYGGSMSPKWEPGPKKYRKVYENIPSPSIDDGYLGCLFYLTGGADQQLYLPNVANIPDKSFIDFVFLGNSTTLTITPQGSTILNTQGSAITIGGQAMSMYRLTFLGRGDVGGVQTDQWALGGSVSSGGGGGMVNPMDGAGQMIASFTPDGAPAKLQLTSGGLVTLNNLGAPYVLPIGTEGQFLGVGSLGLPEWKLLPATMQENFSLLNSTSNYDTSTRNNRIYASKCVSNFTAKRTKLGFFHKSGTLGSVLLGIYDNSGDLLAQTAAFTPGADSLEQVCWEDTLAEFQMVAGEEYWLVVYFTENNWQLNIDALGMEKNTAFDVNFIGSASASAGLAALPATLPSMTYETLAFYIAAK